ncbi:MAG: hypothetical protein M1826_004075 [Phylliscum demangeonii]|nr:MAG: hypothetical protein M1826_004075 [Phylliscum demangeonii]
MALSPEGDSAAPPPNMLVLGTEGQTLDGGVVATTTTMMGDGRRLSSNSSTLSDYSQSSASSSTVTTTTAAATAAAAAAAAAVPTHDHTHAHAHAGAGSSSGCVYQPGLAEDAVILRAAMNNGFQSASDQTLYTWGKTLMSTSCGAAPWLMDLLDQYRCMILIGSAFPPSTCHRAAFWLRRWRCELDNTFLAPTSYILIVLLQLIAYRRLQSRATQPGHGARCRDANAICISTGDETVNRWRPVARRAPANHRGTY